VGLDEMGPESAKSCPGQQLVALQEPPAPAIEAGEAAATAVMPITPARPAGRASQEVDYVRRGKGYLFGAFKPADGEALTAPYAGRTTANSVDFLRRVEAWSPPDIERIYAVMDNLSAHRATDVLLFSLAHPRWEFVFEPKYAPYLNLIEPGWKVLRSLALKGRRCETWVQVCHAVSEATQYWNAHRHPFIGGRRRRHHPVAALASGGCQKPHELSGCTTKASEFSDWHPARNLAQEHETWFQGPGTEVACSSSMALHVLVDIPQGCALQS
jgi:transposase